MDVFLYSGDLRRGLDLRFIDFINQNKKSASLKLVLATTGGSPDAAYKIGRFIQAQYEDFTVYVPGICKSAGTLLAIGANTIAFSPYGELGPLDVQLAKQDSLAGLDSGLNISEAFVTLENRARMTFHNLVQEIITSSSGIVSFITASHSAAEIVSSLYGPIFGKIDPEEVGSRARAMRIGEDYGNRLNDRFGNLRADSLVTLSSTYSSHGFVIDMAEASVLFHRVRGANANERAIEERLGNTCRIPSENLQMENLTDDFGSEVSPDAEVNSPRQAEPANDPGTSEDEGKGTRSNGSDTERAGAA